MAPNALFNNNINQSTPLIAIATRNVVCLAPDDSVGEAARIMAEKRISSIVVTDGNGHPLGILTERNMLQAMQSVCQPRTPLKQIMSSPVITVPASITCLDAYQICLRDGIRHLVIVGYDGTLLGLVSETDFRLHINLAALAGRRQVASTMSRSVFSLPIESSLKDTLLLMQAHRDTCVVVVEDEHPVGIVTERDIVRLYSHTLDRTDIPVREVMTSPVLTIPLDNTINKAATMMLEAKVRHLVVVDDSGRLAGLLSEHDLTQAMALNLIDDKLIAEGAFLHTLMNAIPDMVWLKDEHGVYLACNPCFERFIDVKEQDIIGKTDYDFLDKDLADEFHRHDHLALKKDGPTFNEGWILYNEHRVLLDILRTPMRNSQGNLIGVLGIARDITGRKRAEENLRITASVFENSQEAIVITDTNNAIQDVNPAFTRITGYCREEVLGKNPKLLSSGRHDKAFFAAMWQSLAQEKMWRGEIWNRRKSGEIYAELLSITSICDENGKVQRYVGLFSDISHIKAHEAELSRLAHYDALTGIPNRALLADRLKQAIIHAQRNSKMLAVCYMDLDGFKQINDRYGHGAGDHLLVDVTRRLQEALRAGDTLARLGGDEFVVLFNDLSSAPECYHVLDRILAIVAAPVPIDQYSVTVSTSIGVTFYPQDNVEGDTLLRHADRAMYVAKQTGKNRYHLYDPGHD